METGTGMNDTQATAEALTMTVAPGAPKLSTGFVLGHIATPSDVDWYFSFATDGGATASGCRAGAIHCAWVQGAGRARRSR